MNSVAQVDAPSGFGGSLTHNLRNHITMQPLTNASESIPGGPMDITPPASTSMGPPVNSSPDIEQGGEVNGNVENNTGLHTGTGAAAMVAAQGPKVVQTAFIHKLYNMLEDRSIQHLISWSNTNESFIMSPSNEFSKVLAQYFKHTNISSFVRQLNMYGFHKVSDVFHSGSPDSTMWEFRHGNGNFRKGDLVGLRDIKRRASRHSLIHRDSFSGHKTMPAPPVTPVDSMPDTLEQRMVHMEHTVYRMNQRMSRNDDSLAMLSLKCQALTEGLVRCHQWSHGISSHVQSLAPTESPLYVEVSNMQKEIARQLEMVRSLDHPHDGLLTGRQPYFSTMSPDPHQPLSPRHIPFDESRRSSVQMLEPPAIAIGQGYVGRRSSNLPTSPRSYGVLNISNHNISPDPNFNRPPHPSQRPSIASTITHDDGPNLARRHTSADIREHGWPSNIPPLPTLSHNLNANSSNNHHISSNSSSAYPPSPNRTPTNTNPSTNLGTNFSTVPPPNPNEHQHLRDHLAAYEMKPFSSRRQTSPPPPPHLPTGVGGPDGTTPNEHVGITWPFSGSGGIGGGPKFPRLGGGELHSAPATRRSSMASNVHSLLNPAETAEREGEDEDPSPAAGAGGGGEERKRKRLA